MKAVPALFVISLLAILYGCGKDKFETKPRLEIKDYSDKDIFPGQSLRIRLNYFDKEGDLNGSPVIGILRRLNQVPLPVGQDKVDTFRNVLPDFPSKDNGEISFELPYDFLKESLVENDTLMFRFAVEDLAGNKSDTVDSDQVVVHLP
jgi:hypothetical protein